MILAACWLQRRRQIRCLICLEKLDVIVYGFFKSFQRRFRAVFELFLAIIKNTQGCLHAKSSVFCSQRKYFERCAYLVSCEQGTKQGNLILDLLPVCHFNFGFIICNLVRICIDNNCISIGSGPLISTYLFTRPPTILRSTRIQITVVPETNVSAERLHVDPTPRLIDFPSIYSLAGTLTKGMSVGKTAFY